MFKRIACAVLCAALLVGLRPVARAADITFLAVNDSIPIGLSDETMPFYANSLLYVPVSLFDIEVLGVVPIYDSASRILLLFNDTRSLTFSLDDGTMTNENGTIFSVQVISRGGLLFVPALYCAYHFGLSVSFLTSLGGYPVVRFTTGSQVYDDELFIQMANNLIEYRANQYLSENEEEVPSAGEEPETPDSPSVSEPSGGTEEPDEPDDEFTPAVLYLALTGADGMSTALTALEEADLRAAFFFTAAEIEPYADLILRLYAAGHTVGLVADGSEAEANALLDQILKTRAMCYLADTDARAAEETAGLGGVVFSYASDTQPTLEEAVQSGGITQLYVLEGKALADALRTIADAGASVLQLRETTQLPG